MEDILKKMNLSQLKKVYYKIKFKKTSLNKNKIIFKLLEPLQKKYKMDTIKDKYLKEYMGSFQTDREAGKTLTLLSKSLSSDDSVTNSITDKRHKKYDSKLRKYNKEAMKKYNNGDSLTGQDNLIKIIHDENLLSEIGSILDIWDDDLSGYSKWNKNMLLLNAASEGYTNLVKELLKYGLDPNYFCLVDNSTAFSEAADNNHIDIMRLLLQNGVKIKINEVRLSLEQIHNSNVNSDNELLEILLDVIDNHDHFQFDEHLDITTIIDSRFVEELDRNEDDSEDEMYESESEDENDY